MKESVRAGHGGARADDGGHGVAVAHRLGEDGQVGLHAELQVRAAEGAGASRW